MSKKSRQRQQRRMKLTRLDSQPALQAFSNSTLGDLINLRMAQSNIPKPTELPAVESLTVELVAPAILPTLPTVTQTSHPLNASWPVCPVNCDANEWRRAMENHDHYLQCVKTSGENKKWFHYPRYTYQYSEFVYITPEMAQQLLDHNPINRKVKLSHVEGIKRDILSHRWLQTHESIAINKLGNMHDGQHRALGIIKAAIGWPIYVTWNVPPEALYATDSGDKRPINEKLALLFPDLKMSNKTSAVCRSMMWGLSNRASRYTESEIAEFMSKHEQVINWIMSQTRSMRADMQAVLAKSLLWWGEEIVGRFVKKLLSVEFTGEEPAKALYLWIQKAKKQGRNEAYTSPIVYYKKTLAAIHAHVKNRDARKLIAKEEDVFEWLPGWEVPQNSPCKGVIFLP